ncbi:MFS transporter, partial [Streptomyces sp. SID6648]|nr:MFS transporter [Streptomyces sp. SID6648]
MTATQAPADAPPTSMNHRQILQAMSGLMAGMFVAILAGTVVANALPTIIADLGASQSSYTWVV